MKIVFTLFAACLIINTFYTLLVKKPTYTSHESRLMSAEDFPDIMICPEPNVDLDALVLRGYPGEGWYFKGETFGWAGKKSEDVKNVSLEVSTWKSINDCEKDTPTALIFDGPGKVSEPIKIKYKITKALSPYHLCCKVIPPRRSQQYPLMQFWFGHYGEAARVDSFKIFLLHPNTASYYTLHQTMLGDAIVTTRGQRMLYKVQIMEYNHLENDPNFPCIDYKIRGEYGKCLETEIKKENFKYLNCTPPWMTDWENLWCKGKEKDNLNYTSWSEYELFLRKIELGKAKPKTCLAPCKIKKYQINQIGSRKDTGFGFSIQFESEVEVTKSSWQLDGITFLSNIGGLIGTVQSFFWLIILLLSSLGALMSYLNRTCNKAC